MGVFLFSLIIILIIYTLGFIISNIPLKYKIHTAKDKTIKLLLGLALSIFGWTSILGYFLPHEIITTGLFEWDPALELFLFIVLLLFLFILAFLGIFIMIFIIIQIDIFRFYAHPELLNTTEEHLIFFTGIGSDKIGYINGTIIKRFQQLAEKTKGKELSDHFLVQASLPTKINNFKKYPLDNYIHYVQILKLNLNYNQNDIHDTMVRNYYTSSRLGKMIKHIDKKRIVDVIAMSYRMITNKGQLIIIKITDDRAVLNFYIETKYRELLKIILGLYRVELNMYGKKSKVKAIELIRHGDAICYRIVVNFLS
jgi:hypothetical protein